MRRSLLDRLVCPRCEGFPLALTARAEHQVATPVVTDTPCALYCAHQGDWLRALAEAPPCTSCLGTQVSSGTLACPLCGARYPLDDAIPNLLTEDVTTDWVVQEKAWWDRRHRRMRYRRSSRLRMAGAAGGRHYERRRYLFEPLRRRGARGAWILELGAGSAQSVALALPPSVERFLYVGTDVSREALRTGAQSMPAADFVQCAAGRLPFRPESFDVLISLGVLHHVPSWQPTLGRALALLRPGGWLLFNEAIEKPHMLGGILKRVLGTAVDSPYGGAVAGEDLLGIMRAHGRLLAHRTGATSLRVLLVWIGGPWVARSIRLTRVVLWLDELFLRSVGRVFPRVGGAAEAIGILEKHPRPGGSTAAEHPCR